MNYKLNTELIKSKMLQKGYSITKLASISQISKSTAARAVKRTRNPKTPNHIQNIKITRHRHKRHNTINKRGGINMFKTYIEEINNIRDLESVINYYYPNQLKRNKMSCPFHNDKNTKLFNSRQRKWSFL